MVNGVTTTFLLDGGEEVGEYDGSGGLLRRYVPSGATDAPIAMVEGTGGATVRSWFHRNRLGSTIAMSSGAGAVGEGPLTYDAFGNSASVAGSTPRRGSITTARGIARRRWGAARGSRQARQYPVQSTGGTGCGSGRGKNYGDGNEEEERVRGTY